MEEKQLTSRELEEQANALLAETDFEEIKLPKKAKKAAAAKKAEQENEQAEKPAEKFPPLDEKLVASLPAAALLQSNEKLMDIFAKGKAKGKLSSNDLMETIDEMNLESEQLDQIYDSLETLGVDIGTTEAIDSSIDDMEPPMEEIAGIEEEELVDPNELVDSFSTDDPVRMYLKEIGKVSLLSADEEISLATAMSEGMEAKQKLEEAEKNGTELSEEEMKALKSAVKKGEHSKQRLAEANLRLVVSIAKRYVGRGMLFLVFVGAGIAAEHIACDVSAVRAVPELTLFLRKMTALFFAVFAVSLHACRLLSFLSMTKTKSKYRCRYYFFSVDSVPEMLYNINEPERRVADRVRCEFVGEDLAK